MNKTMESLLSAVNDLLTVYKSMSVGQQSDSSGGDILMSHCNMEEYHTAEERFTQELVGFTKKQFFDVSRCK
jgi:HAUS augmin-like complex subunit 3